MPDSLEDAQVATINEAEFRTGLYESALAGIRDGAVVEMVDGLRSYHISQRRTFDADGSKARIQVLTEAALAERRHGKSARRLAASVAAEDPETAQDFIQDALRHAKRAREIEAEISQVETKKTPNLIEPFETDGAYIARGLANLAHLNGKVDAAVADSALRLVGSMHVVEHGPRTITFEWWLRFPVAGGVARLGPLRFVVRHATPPARLLPPAITRFLAEVEGPDSAPPRSVSQMRRRARLELTSRGMSAHQAIVLSMCVIPEAVEVITAKLLGRRRPTMDPAFARKVEATYLGEGFAWMTSFYSTDCHTRQVVCDTLRDLGGTATFGDVVDAVAADDRPGRPSLAAMRAAMSDQPRNGRRAIPATVTLLDGDRVLLGSRVALVTCMHCGADESFPVHVPELPDMLLCSTCWKMPRIADSPTYPESYGMLRSET